MTPLDTELQALVEAIGYTYPGSPAAAVRLLCAQITEAKQWATNERVNYERLLAEVLQAVAHARTTSWNGDAVRTLANTKLESATIRLAATPDEAELILAFHVLAGQPK